MRSPGASLVPQGSPTSASPSDCSWYGREVSWTGLAVATIVVADALCWCEVSAAVELGDTAGVARGPDANRSTAVVTLGGR